MRMFCVIVWSIAYGLAPFGIAKLCQSHDEFSMIIVFFLIISNIMMFCFNSFSVM